MPNRILRDWTDSDRVNSLSAEAERLFIRLIMKADDYGRYLGGAGPRINTDLGFAIEKVDAIQELKIFEISEVDRQARVAFFPKLEYPVSLRHVRASVKAVLTFIVNTDGTVGTIEAVSDVSHPEFTPVLRDWVKQWRFEAAAKDGQSVPQRVRQPVQVKPDWT